MDVMAPSRARCRFRGGERWFAAFCIVASACGGSAESGAELPAGWEGAARVEQFLQFACSGSPLSGGDEHVEARGAEGQVLVEYLDAHFRCAQDVEAFVKESGDELEVLVQPIEMDPSAVAGCDCLYEIHLIVETSREQDYTLTLYRRWDNINEGNAPVKIGSAEVSAKSD